jgi:6-phospho-beta-glucosidase
MKVAVVGGGSTYTPELVDGFARLRHLLPVEELVLTDPNQERLDVVGGVAERILAKQGHPGRLVRTTDLDQALDGASVVLLQLRVGGQDARNVDETLPLECGCVGQETTGAGGLAKALRTVPVVLDIAERVRARADDKAWIVDFTNPVGIVTRALLDAGHRAVGLCNVAIGNQRRVAEHLAVDPSRVELDHVGLNHLTWTRRVLVDGVDVLPDLLERGHELLTPSGLPLDLLPQAGGLAVLLPAVLLRARCRGRRAEGSPVPGRRGRAIERQLLDLYADPALDEKPALLEQRGGAYYSEAAVNLVASLVADRGDVQVVNLRNNGTLPFLDDSAVIEVPARVGGSGVTAVPVEPLDPLFAGLVAHVSAYEQLALDAAVHGGT